MRRFALSLVVLLSLSVSVAHAAPEPTGPHPRILLDNEVRRAWRAAASLDRGPIAGSIALCESGRSQEHDRAVYMGSEWSRVLQACLVAYVATDKPEHAKTAIKFFEALLDDLDRIGDGAGGDDAAKRDSGYSLRNLGVYTAIAYDWLHDKLTPAQRQHARDRWNAWLTWYREKGYRSRVPGTNYQSGFLAAATLIAIAQGGEATEQRGPELWAFVHDELWGKDMAAALAPGGILDGGDWPEGWQYGPLAIAHYSLAARAARDNGIVVDGVDRWLASVLRRHAYALSPGDRVYVAQDSESETPNVDPHVLTLNAIALGDAAPEVRAHARSELSRLRIADKDFFLYDALATGDAGTAIPRATWPTLYTAPNTGTIYTRTRWDARAIWFVAECGRGLDVDHRQPKAGNFVLSRGPDDAIVDPSPYGSASSLTSNAPTVFSPQLPADYHPSQGHWGARTTWDFATQTRSGIVAARCDYAGAYQLQKKPSDISDATRDFILVPDAAGTDGALVVLDRAQASSMNLRFRVAGGLPLADDRADKTFGSTRLTIAGTRSSGRAVVGRPSQKDCFAKDTIKGRCDAARFEASDYRVEIDGPAPHAVHVIGVVDQRAQPVSSSPLAGDGFAGVEIANPRAASIVWPTRGGALAYRAKPGTHVILDAPSLGGFSTITAQRDGDACRVKVTPGGATPAQPLIATLDARCAIAIDPATSTATSAIGTKASRVPRGASEPRSSRAGCCGAQATPGASIAMTLVVLALVLRRARRARTSRDASPCPR
jgi:uncharacterized protein (TIGR03382 family)